ncbi:SRPBCC domain-containing protein [Planctomonas psychrotolerans]|uniref:SRPBCC domain-containing protein n=1 Tax=Planctomonas psychrotolerans TaxID=2528712 RepID=UPI001D0CFC79|nr:SRPBCC domain-containing protein [Planctomonas psychrotolerans]
MPLLSRAIHPADQRVVLDWAMATTPGRLWWGLTDAEALPQWLGTPTAGTYVRGGEIIVEHAENYSCTSRVRECVPERLLDVTWQFPDEPLSRLRIAVTPAGASTQMRLEHEGLGDAVAGYLPGWHTHLLYLEALLLDSPRPMDDLWTTYERLVECGADDRPPR